MYLMQNGYDFVSGFGHKSAPSHSINLPKNSKYPFKDKPGEKYTI